MLSIRPIGSSKQQVLYYVNLGKEDYYVNGGEAPGRWFGSATKALGLDGIVRGEQLRNLMRGFSVSGTAKLVQNAGQANRRSAFDLTFSVPKSVSVAWSHAEIDERKKIETCCEHAIAKSIEAFEALCGITRRGHDGETIQDAKLAMAVFRHETSRAIPGSIPDPNLHWHVVVPNVAVRSDGSTGAFDARNLFAKNMKMALGALFRAELSAELSKQGLRSYRPKRPNREQRVSWFELASVPKKLIEKFSKRRKEIESWLAKHGLSGAKNAEKAALKTRHAKTRIKRDELLQQWRKHGAEYGYDASTISAEMSQSASRDQACKSMADIFQSALTRITDHYSTFTKTELLRFVAEEAQTNGIGIDAIIGTVDLEVADGNQITVLGYSSGQQMYSTPEMVAVEKRMHETARTLTYRRKHHVHKDVLDACLGKYPTLHNEQTEAIKHIARSTDLVCVNGIAGSGKTFMLSIAKEALERSGYSVLGTALAAKAAKTLEQESGIQSTHIHDLIWKLENQQLVIDSDNVIVVDEAGMIGTKIMNRLISIAESGGAKLVLVGDHRQLQAISAGAPFRSIAERFGCKEMNHIRRQRDGWARQAVYDFRAGKSQLALAEYHKRGLLHVADDVDASIEQLVKDWSKTAIHQRQLKSTLIFASTNLEVALINQACQTARHEAGSLGSHFEIDGSGYYVGDRIVITKNLRSLGLRNGSLGTIAKYDKDNQSVSIDFDDGLQVWIDINVFSKFKLAYAVSTHKGQGQTVENAYVLVGGSMTDREITYVQSSRARGDTRLYTDTVSLGGSLDFLSAQMNRSRAKSMASDHLQDIA